MTKGDDGNFVKRGHPLFFVLWEAGFSNTAKMRPWQRQSTESIATRLSLKWCFRREGIWTKLCYSINPQNTSNNIILFNQQSGGVHAPCRHPSKHSPGAEDSFKMHYTAPSSGKVFRGSAMWEMRENGLSTPVLEPRQGVTPGWTCTQNKTAFQAPACAACQNKAIYIITEA